MRRRSFLLSTAAFVAAAVTPVAAAESLPEPVQAFLRTHGGEVEMKLSVMFGGWVTFENASADQVYQAIASVQLDY